MEASVPFKSFRSWAEHCTLSNNAAYANINLRQVAADDSVVVQKALENSDVRTEKVRVEIV